MARHSVPDEIATTIASKVAFLSSAAAYPNMETGSFSDIVEIRETRMAWVFLAGDRVFKFKKPAGYPHLRHSTLSERRHLCAEEVRLNRRFAPEVYLGLASLTVEPEGTFAINGHGRVVEWLVEMKRLPDELFLDHAIRSNTVRRAQIISVAQYLAHFFATAQPVKVDPDDRIAACYFELGEHRKIFQRRDFDAVGKRGLDIVGQLEVLLQRNPQIVTDRVSGGYIVEGHGDLRPEHVHLSDPPVIIDCLEFRRDLRLLDPLEEVAYLAMECSVQNARWIGPVLIDTCAALLETPPSKHLLVFYTAFRATLRARQALAHLLNPHPRTPEKWLPLAQAYLDEAEAAMVILALPANPPKTDPREVRE